MKNDVIHEYLRPTFDAWMDARIELNSQAQESATDLWRDCRDWCMANGGRVPFGRGRFFNTILAAGAKRYTTPGHRTYYVGVQLKTPAKGKMP